MASDVPMSPELEQVDGEIQDIFRTLHLIKEFDRILKDVEKKNPAEVNKQLNGKKQFMIKELNSYVTLRKTYQSSLGNKRIELFDTGNDQVAEDNVQTASGGLHRSWNVCSPGLEYLHKGCNPPLIHRNVKATNILLNARLEAKIADFGLSKAFNRDNTTHVSTNTLVGTPGYVDPEYQATMQLTMKSDVFSFGVMLLELVTGKPAILHDPEPANIIQWARQRLARGNIEGVVDARMCGDLDVNIVWKVADIALKCTAQASAQRPTMTDVVAQLQECLELEESRAGGDANGSFYTGGSGNPAQLEL